MNSSQGRVRLRLFFCFLFLSTVSTTVFAGDAKWQKCADYLRPFGPVKEQLSDRTLTVLQPNDVRAYEGRLLALEDIFKRKDIAALYISDWGHYMVYVDGLIMDANILAPRKVKERDKGYFGYFFVFDHVSKTQLDRLKTYVQGMQGKRSIGCVFAAIDALQKGLGIKLADGRGAGFSLEKAFRRILDHGFKDENDDRVPFQTIKVTDLSLQETLDEMKSSDQEIFQEYVEFPWALAKFPLIAAIVTIILHNW